MSGAVVSKLGQLVKDGMDLEVWGDYADWRGRATEFVRGTFGNDARNRFDALGSDNPEWWREGRGRQVGMLEALEAQGAATEEKMAEEVLSRSPGGVSTALSALQSRKVFVVHGHDDGAKDAVARFLGQVGLDAIILHEQANAGRAIIEKFEAHSDVAFAVVLLTPDDIGSAKADQENLKPRARQNVIFELGYFVGKLTRGRVCALYKGGVELPSDLQGVLYVELDAKRAWRMQLAQELMNVRLPIKLEGVLGS